jgi:hypothetical protein
MRMCSLIGPGQLFASGASSGVRVACIEILNVMLAAWGNDGINIPSEVPVAPFTVTTGDGEYTVGPAGNIVTPRPVAISSAKWKVGDNETDLWKLTDQEYQDWRNKAETGTPRAFHYTKGSPNGTLRLLPLPEAADAVVLYAASRFTAYTTGTETIALPDYDEAIRNNLALRFLSELASTGAKMAPDALALTRERARDSRADIQRLNLRAKRTYSDFPGSNQYLTQEEFESGSFLFR